MNVQPIQSFKAMPTQKKAAIVAGTAVGVAALATGAAYLSGKKSVSADVKGLKAVGEAIRNGFVGAKDKVVEFFKSLKKEKVEGASEQAAAPINTEAAAQ